MLELYLWKPVDLETALVWLHGLMMRILRMLLKVTLRMRHFLSGCGIALPEPNMRHLLIGKLMKSLPGLVVPDLMS